MMNNVFTSSETKYRFSDSIARKHRGKAVPLTGMQKRMFVNDTKVFDAKINCSTRACYYRIRFVISSFHFIPVAHMTTSVNKCYYSVA